MHDMNELSTQHIKLFHLGNPQNPTDAQKIEEIKILRSCNST